MRSTSSEIAFTPLTKEEILTSYTREYESSFLTRKRLYEDPNLGDFQKVYEVLKDTLWGIDVLISDDAWGRITTLFIAQIYKKLFWISIKTLFIPSGRIRYNEEFSHKMMDFLEKFWVTWNQYLLFVSEFVASWHTIESIATILRNIWYTNTTYFSTVLAREKSSYEVENILCIKENKWSFAPLQSHYWVFSGVKKTRINEHQLQRNQYIPQWIINQVRADIQTLVSMIEL